MGEHKMKQKYEHKTYLQVVCLTDEQLQIEVVRSVFLPKLEDKH